MNKLFSILMIALMAAQIWRPFVVPGLRRRGDFWKIALAAMLVFGLDVLLRPH